MKWSDFETRITGAMLGNKSYTLTITEIVVEEVHPRPGVTSKSPVLHFKETSKSLVLSPTNCRALSKLFGDDVTECRGKKIIVAAQAMRVAGRDTNPVRIMGVPSGPAASLDTEPAPAPEDDLIKDEIEEAA